MKKDLSGMISTGYRGVRMGDELYYVGTIPPSPEQVYDCCSDKGYTSVTDENIEWYWFYSKKRAETHKYGRVNIAKWMEVEGYTWQGLCNLDYGKIQPDNYCVNNTFVHQDILCSLLAMCSPNASCNAGPVGPPPRQYEMKNPGNCPTGEGSALVYDHLMNELSPEEEYQLLLRTYRKNLFDVLTRIESGTQNEWGLNSRPSWIYNGFLRNAYGTGKFIKKYGFGDLLRLLFTDVEDYKEAILVQSCSDIAYNLSDEFEKLNLKHWDFTVIPLGIHYFVYAFPIGRPFSGFTFDPWWGSTYEEWKKYADELWVLGF